MCPSACPSNPVQKKRFEKKEKEKPTLCLAEEKPLRKGAAVPRPAFVSPLARSAEEICKKNGSFLPLQCTQTHADARRRASKGSE